MASYERAVEWHPLVERRQQRSRTIGCGFVYVEAGVVFRIILHDDFRIISDANLVIIQIVSCRRELGARGLTEAAGSAKFPSGGTDGRDLFWFAADLQLN